MSSLRESDRTNPNRLRDGDSTWAHPCQGRSASPVATGTGFLGLAAAGWPFVLLWVGGGVGVVTQGFASRSTLLAERARRSWWLPTGAGLAVVAALALVFGVAKTRPLSTVEAAPLEPRPENQEWATSNGRGKVLAARGDPERALAEFNRAISLNPGHAVLYANRGGVRLQLGDRQGAIVDCSRAIELDPHCVEGLLNRAQARKELADWTGASDDYSKSLEFLHPSDLLREAVSMRLEDARRKARQ